MNRARVGCKITGNQVKERSFAGTVRPDEAADMSFVDVERQLAQRDDAAEAHGDVVHFQ